jgi:hypothetical protein
VVLQTASRDQIERVLADPIFRKHIDGLVEASRQAAKAPAWFQKSARPDNRSGFSAPSHRRRWHVWVEGIPPGQLYAYRVDGPYEPSAGHRFNFNKLLLDPFATAISRVPRRSGTWLSRSWTIPARCQNAYLSTSPSIGMTTSHPGIRGRRPSTWKSIATTTRNLERYAEGLLEGMRVARGALSVLWDRRVMRIRAHRTCILRSSNLEGEGH